MVVDIAVPGLSLIAGFGLLVPGNLAIACCGAFLGLGNMAKVFRSIGVGSRNLASKCFFSVGS